MSRTRNVIRGRLSATAGATAMLAVPMVSSRSGVVLRTSARDGPWLVPGGVRLRGSYRLLLALLHLELRQLLAERGDLRLGLRQLLRLELGRHLGLGQLLRLELHLGLE